MIKISKRLEAISSLIPINSNVLDIGCDHGLLDIYLYQKKISSNIIAADVNSNALSNAKENIKKYKLDKIITTRLGDGLDVLNDSDNTNTLVIAGMGAHTVMRILLNGLDKLKKINTIIIQSNTKLEFLRHEMSRLNYKIVDEELVCEASKYYTIIKYEKGHARYNKKELYFGPILMKKNSSLFKENNRIELEKLNMLLKLLPKNKIIERHKIKKKIRLYK